MTGAELYLSKREGSVQHYREFLFLGQRRGQAFFNALSDFDQERLCGEDADPFHKDGDQAIQDAIEWLLSTE